MSKPAITHLAGNQVVIGNYAIQRCLLCGEVLGEYRADMMMGVCSDGSAPTIPMLTTGGFYEVDGNRTSLVAEPTCPVYESDLDLPENCCIRLKANAN
jgi:hypothetical protein